MRHWTDYDVSKHHPKKIYNRQKREVYSDSVYTLDTEVTSIFSADGDNWCVYSDTWLKEYLDNALKGSLCYIWMLSVDDTVVYGRHLSELSEFFDKLCTQIGCKFRIYVHNLAYDFQIIRKYIPFDKVFARKNRHPIFAQAKNAVFCCSYMLTRKSLAKCAENYTTLSKKIGDLNYNQLRTPDTPLTRTEKKYCQYDCLVLYQTILHFRGKYGTIANIPYTQTGEVRHSFKQQLTDGDHGQYLKLVKRLVPSPEMQMLLRQILEGGDTHANCAYVGDTVSDVRSFDKTSAHPSQFFLKKFPLQRWGRIKDRPLTDLLRRYPCTDYAWIATFTFSHIRPKKTQTYISTHRCRGTGIVADNGRVLTADTITITCTEIDYLIIRMCYNVNVDDIQVSDIYISKKEYLPKELLDWTLSFYQPKTSLKDVVGKELEYLNSKEQLNGIYGACITDIFGDVPVYDGEWEKPKKLTMTDVADKLDKQKALYSTYNLIYQVGVWTPLYSRLDLWQMITACGCDEIYHDTDCVHFIGDHGDYAEKINAHIIKKLKECEERYGYAEGAMSPFDNFGNPHPIGAWEEEKPQAQFRTLGAKKYAVVDSNGKNLTITISGVNKKQAVKECGKGVAMTDIEDFKDGYIFDQWHSGRTISEYIDNEQTYIIDGKSYTQKSGICLYPSTYELGSTYTLSELQEIIDQSSHEI